MTTDRPTYENPGPGYGYKGLPGYTPGHQDTYGEPWPPEAVRNGTKPIPREVRVAAENRVRAYLEARAAEGLTDDLVMDDDIRGTKLYASDLLTLLGPDHWMGDGGPPDTEVDATEKRGLGGDDETTEIHESFGYAEVNRGTSTGTTLFDSDVIHQEVVTLCLGRNQRHRGLNRDWLYGYEELIEVQFSIAQWGAMISSFGRGGGVPCTITRTAAQGLVPGAPHRPRLAHSTAEVKDSAQRALAKVETATDALLAAFEAKAGRTELRKLIGEVARHVEQAPGNIAYTTKSLDDHVEKVVNNARADIEAMVDSRARQLGIDPGVVLHGWSEVGPGEAQPALEAGDDELPELEG